jgi:hypothetical protein
MVEQSVTLRVGTVHARENSLAGDAIRFSGRIKLTSGVARGDDVVTVYGEALARHGREGGSTCCQMQKLPAWKFHNALLD